MSPCGSRTGGGQLINLDMTNIILWLSIALGKIRILYFHY